MRSGRLRGAEGGAGASWPGWHATRSKPSAEDVTGPAMRRGSLRMWWTPDKRDVAPRTAQLPDVMGATFEATIQKLTEQMKPAKGQAWDSFEHRAADALDQLV